MREACGAPFLKPVKLARGDPGWAPLSMLLLSTLLQKIVILHETLVLRTRPRRGGRARARAIGGRRPSRARSGDRGRDRGVHDVAGWATAWLDLGIPVCARAATELPATAAARAFMWLSSRTRCRQRATAHSPEIAKSSARCASRVALSISLKQGFSSIWPLLMAARRTPSMPTAVHRPEMSPSSIRSSLRRAR